MAGRLAPVVVRFTIRRIARWMYRPRDPAWVSERRRAEFLARWTRIPPEIDTEQTDLDGVPAERLRPRDGAGQRVVLYLHGGGYVLGSPRTYRQITGRLTAAAHSTTYAIDYRLAPEHPCPAAVDDAMRAYRALLGHGYTAEQIAVVGDSAGGAMAMALVLAAREVGLPLPGVLGLICPLVDLTRESSAFELSGNREPLLTRDLVGRYVAAYARDDAGSSTASPLYADLAGFPPLVIDAASDDILVGDGRRLVDRARTAGVAFRYVEHPNLGHDFHLAAGLWSYADTALDNVAADLCAALDTTAAQRLSLGSNGDPEGAA